jgi:hypothetical protein
VLACLAGLSLLVTTTSLAPRAGGAARSARLLESAEGGIAVARAAAAADWDALRAASARGGGWLEPSGAGLAAPFLVEPPTPGGAMHEEGTDLAVRDQRGFYNEVYTVTSVATESGRAAHRVEIELVGPVLREDVRRHPEASPSRPR